MTDPSTHEERKNAIVGALNSMATHHSGVSASLAYADELNAAFTAERAGHVVTAQNYLDACKNGHELSGQLAAEREEHAKTRVALGTAKALLNDAASLSAQNGRRAEAAEKERTALAARVKELEALLAGLPTEEPV